MKQLIGNIFSQLLFICLDSLARNRIQFNQFEPSSLFWLFMRSRLTPRGYRMFICIRFGEHVWIFDIWFLIAFELSVFINIAMLAFVLQTCALGSYNHFHHSFIMIEIKRFSLLFCGVMINSAKIMGIMRKLIKHSCLLFV